MNRLGAVIFYVKDVEKTLAFYEKAFGLVRSFIDPTNQYGQLETGTTALGFASHELAQENLIKKYRSFSVKEVPGCEISFLTKDIHRSLNQAIAAGGELLASPQEKPWGQTIAYVRDFNGILIEIGTEMQPSPQEECPSCCCH